MVNIPNVLELKNLSIGYKGSPLISEISFDLKQGQLAALIGRNGVGKSTLFKTIQGNLPAIAGEILIDQKNILSYSSLEKSKLISVVLTQRPILYGMKVSEIIKMGRHPYSSVFGGLNTEDEKIVERCVSALKIEKIANKFLYEISDGEYQKMMLARALAQDTKLIIMDEPSAFLDYPSKIELLDTLQNLCSAFSKTILFSTHEIPLIENKVDLIIGMTSKELQVFDLQKDKSERWKQDILGLA